MSDTVPAIAWLVAFLCVSHKTGALLANDAGESLIALVAVLWSREWQHSEHGRHKPSFEEASIQLLTLGKHADVLAEVTAKHAEVAALPTPADIANGMAFYGWTPVEPIRRLH